MLQIWVLDVSSYGLHININIQLKSFNIIHVHWRNVESYRTVWRRKWNIIISLTTPFSCLLLFLFLNVYLYSLPVFQVGIVLILCQFCCKYVFQLVICILSFVYTLMYILKISIDKNHRYFPFLFFSVFSCLESSLSFRGQLNTHPCYFCIRHF